VQNRQNPDRGLISQKSRDLFARFLKYPGITNYFLTDNSWTDGGVENGHGGVLTGARPPAVPVRRSSPAGVQQREERTGNSIRASPGLEQRRGGRAMTMQSGETGAIGERVAEAGREGSVSGERCGELSGGCSPFIRVGEQRGGLAEAVNAGVNVFNAIEGIKGR
jgi:hypothetical protein